MGGVPLRTSAIRRERTDVTTSARLPGADARVLDGPPEARLATRTACLSPIVRLPCRCASCSRTALRWGFFLSDRAFLMLSMRGMNPPSSANAARRVRNRFAAVTASSCFPRGWAGSEALEARIAVATPTPSVVERDCMMAISSAARMAQIIIPFVGASISFARDEKSKSSFVISRSRSRPERRPQKRGHAERLHLPTQQQEHSRRNTPGIAGAGFSGRQRLR